LIPGSARANLLDTGAVLSDSIPPVALLQLAVANLFGDLSDIGSAWWGSRFFGGVPYILSLYVGATTIALAATGLAAGCWFRKRLLVILVLGLAFCMGDALGAGKLVDWLPVARVLRYPVKLFASVQFALALLVGYGLHALSNDARRAWQTFLWTTAGLGLALTVPLAAWLGGSAPVRARLDEFIGDAIAVSHRQAAASFVLWDAALGGALALAAGLLGLLVVVRRLRPALAAGLVCAVMTIDLVRAGAGLNPMVTPDFDAPSPETARLYASINQLGGRVFTCDVVAQKEYYDARRARRDRGDSYVFAAFIESATPHTNVRAGLATALSADLFSLVPVERTGSADELTCDSMETMEPRLRIAGVTHVVSVKELSHTWLRPLATLYPRRLAPLGLRIYALADPLPRLEVAEEVATAASPEQARRLVAQPRLQRPGTVVVEAPAGASAAPGDVRLIAQRPGWFSLRTEARADTVLVVREGFDSGWAATVNGVEAPIWRANARHLGLPIPAGVADVVLRHRPWQLDLGALLGGLSGLVVLGMLVPRS
jgi:hypothetical protein